MNAGALTLASAGLRAVVEAMCLDRGCTGKNLVAKINDLAARGEVTKAQADFFNVHRYLGNEAVHDLSTPPVEEFVEALGVLEQLLKTLYEVPAAVARINKMRKARGARV